MKKIILIITLTCIAYGQTKKEIVEYAERVSDYYGIPDYIVPAIIQVESSFNIRAVSYMDARGLMQVRMAAYIDFTNACGSKWCKSFDDLTNNWRGNVICGTWYYYKRCYKVKKDWYEALTAYNQGPNQTNTCPKYKNKVLSLRDKNAANESR